MHGHVFVTYQRTFQTRKPEHHEKYPLGGSTLEFGLLTALEHPALKKVPKEKEKKKKKILMLHSCQFDTTDR